MKRGAKEMTKVMKAGIAALTVLACASPLAAQQPPPKPKPADTMQAHVHRPGMNHDSAFAALQARGRAAMGVDQYTSTHQFDILPDGGRIELQRDEEDAEGTAVIRAHLQSIAEAFRAGDFTTPFMVHADTVPGTRVMAERRAHITYTFRPLPRGGEVRLTTRDPAALAAIREFMEFQRHDHRAGGKS